MVHASNKVEYSSIDRTAIAEGASLEEVGGPSPYSAMFISNFGRTMMTSETSDFRSVLHPLVSNGNPFVHS